MTDFEDYGSRHLSFEACEQLAGQVRTFLGCDNFEPLPHIQEVLARFDIVPMPRSHGFMGDALASARLQTKDIDVREDLVDEILKDTRVARFTLLHELAHLIDHGKLDAGKLFRKASGNQRLRFLADDESVEGQADNLADAVLMPVEMVMNFNSARDLAAHAHVPLQRAFFRLNLVKNRSVRATPSQISAEIAKQKEIAREGAGFWRAKTTLYPETEARLLWELAPKTDDPQDEFRCIDGFYTIRWSRRGKMEPAGWRVADGRIIPWESERGH